MQNTYYSLRDYSLYAYVSRALEITTLKYTIRHDVPTVIWGGMLVREKKEKIRCLYTLGVSRTTNSFAPPIHGLRRAGARSAAATAEITTRPPTTVTRSGRYGSPIRE